MLYAGTLNRLSQPLAGALCLQKLKTVVARERQFVSMPRRVDCLAMNPVSCGTGHRRMVAFLAARLGYASQNPATRPICDRGELTAALAQPFPERCFRSNPGSHRRRR